MTIEAESKLDILDIIGSTVLDLFDFAWYLRCEQQQVNIINGDDVAITSSSNQTLNLVIFETIGREKKYTNERECSWLRI